MTQVEASNARSTHLDAVLRSIMASFFRHAGFRSISKTALAVMTDLYVDVLLALGAAVQQYAGHAGRSEANLFDLVQLFHLSTQSDLLPGAGADAIAHAQSIAPPAATIGARAGLDLDVTSLVTWLETHMTHHFLYTMDGQNYHHRRATVQLLQRRPKIKRLAFLDPNRPELGVKPPTAQLPIPPQVNKLRTSLHWQPPPPALAKTPFPVEMCRVHPSTLSATVPETLPAWTVREDSAPTKRIKFDVPKAAEEEKTSLAVAPQPQQQQQLASTGGGFSSTLQLKQLSKRLQQSNPYCQTSNRVASLPSPCARSTSTYDARRPYIQSAAMLVKALEESHAHRAVKPPWDFPTDLVHVPPPSFVSTASLYATTLSRQQSRWMHWVDQSARRIAYYPTDLYAAGRLAHLAEHVIVPTPSAIVEVQPLELKLRDTSDAKLKDKVEDGTMRLRDRTVEEKPPVESFKLKLGKSEPVEKEAVPLKLSLSKPKGPKEEAIAPSQVKTPSLADQIFGESEPPKPASPAKPSLKLSFASLKQPTADKVASLKQHPAVDEVTPLKQPSPVNKVGETSSPDRPKTILKLNARAALPKAEVIPPASPSSSNHHTEDHVKEEPKESARPSFKLKLNLKAPPSS